MMLVSSRDGWAQGVEIENSIIRPSPSCQNVLNMQHRGAAVLRPAISVLRC